MKFEKCKECGIVYDRIARGGHCPHCNVGNWFYAIGGGLIIIGALAATALIVLL